MEIFIIIFSVIFDALRDVFHNDPNWWKRHLIKWGQFYPPLAYILLIADYHYSVKIIIVMLSCFLWRMVIKICGKNWKSFWWELIKSIWKKIWK